MLPLLIVALFADVAVPARNPAKAGPVLRVELHGHDITEYRLVGRDGGVLWKRAPAGLIASTPAKKSRIDAYKANPRAPLTKLGYPFQLVEIHQDDIVVVSAGNFSVLARSDGRLRFQREVGEAGFGSLDAKHADVIVDLAWGKCVGRRVAPPALVWCNDRVVYWWSMGMQAFKTAPWQDAGALMFHDVTPPDPQTHDYTFDLGDGKIRVQPVE